MQAPKKFENMGLYFQVKSLKMAMLFCQNDP